MIDKFNVHFTGRLMPEDQNSGGFYLALLRKKESAKETVCSEEEIAEEEIDEEVRKLLDIGEEKQVTTNGHVGNSKPKKNSYQTSSETGFLPLPEPVWLEIKKDFGITDDFKKELLFVASEKCKNVHIVSPKIAEYFRNDTRSALKFINYGTVLFAKTRVEANTPNCYRISQSGIRYLRPFMKNNVISIDFDEFKYFLCCKCSVSHDDLFNTKEIDGTKFTKLSKNSYCLVYKGQSEESEEELLMISKMEHSIVVMVPKEDIAGFRIKYQFN